MTTGRSKRARPNHRDGTADVPRRHQARLAAEAAAGDADAFRSLYRRHAPMAWGLASAVAADPLDAAEAMVRAFAEVLATARPHDPGTGATGATGATIRTQLLAATRAAAVARHRRAEGAPRPAVDLENLRVPPRERRSGEEEGDYDDATMAGALRTLPERWRTALWLTAVAGLPADRVAPVLGVPAEEAERIALRARAGLRERFVQDAMATTARPACRDTLARLVARADSLPPSARDAVGLHLVECTACADRADDLVDLGPSLRRVVLPLPLALAGEAEGRWRRHVEAASAAPAPARRTEPARRMPAAALAPAHLRDRSAAGVAGRPSARLPLAAGHLARAHRPLAATSTGLFALGVIAASVVSNPATRTGDSVQRAPVPPVEPVPPQTVEALALAATGGFSELDGAGLDQFGAAPGGRSPGGAATGAGAGEGATVQLPAGLRGPAPAPAPTATAPGAAPEPLAQTAGALNVAGLPIGASAGVGAGDCTGLQAGALTVGCAPPAPPDATGLTLDNGGALADLLPDQSIVLPF
ncbi:MAG TPA: sigma-70 family RNA polymerase sigma factor [Acidimicrobiales bacterium]|nr:sigma-70 family RNA polymerase sigma factor [Acidimicrobiales bacterium]